MKILYLCQKPKYRIYKKLKDEKNADQSFNLFNKYLASLNRERPTRTRVNVDVS